ncbi:zinc dependent phospholipase C family protein [Floccifex sp.]|uniref:zinc dependent phospholipase C family protein n=1 Tax=Floccifex sp. TaxID=2815810 RepID=UPI003EFE34F3
MPNIITHTIFADEVLENLDWNLSSKQLYEIGSNGPDYLFFHGLNPTHLKAHSNCRTLGSICHKSNVNDFYLSCLESIRKEQDLDVRQDMIAYVCGHLCHWILDATVHPYVFYRTGDCTGQSSWWHHRFESVLDAIVLKVKREVTIKDYKAYEICDVSKELVRAIARIYVPIAKNVFDLDVKPHEIMESLQDWCAIEKILYDASGRKLKSLSSVELALGKENALSGLIVPNEPDDPFDTCNLLHNAWCHPCDDTKISTASFFDLYEQAKRDALYVIPLFVDCIDDETKQDDLFSFIGNRNYDLGISKDLPMKYFKLIY